MYFVYILLCKDGSLYTGMARDVAARIKRHMAGRGSRYVRIHGVDRLIFTERKKTIGDALRRERQIKALGRSGKLALAKKKQRRRSSEVEQLHGKE